MNQQTTKTIEDLPNEILLIIFDYLNFNILSLIQLT